MGDRYAAEYPLPGGVEHYFDSLLKFLRRVSEEPTTADQLREWVPEAFPGASGGAAAISGYLSSIGRMELWSATSGMYRVTTRGAELLQLAELDQAAAKRQVLKRKIELFDGYDVVLAQLRARPATFLKFVST